MTEKSPETAAEEVHDHEKEDYVGGSIQAYHGYIPIWLLVVYLVLCIWGLIYAYQYWGGLGPGRIVS